MAFRRSIAANVIVPVTDLSSRGTSVACRFVETGISLRMGEQTDTLCACGIKIRFSPSVEIGTRLVISLSTLAQSLSKVGILGELE
jgi:hypothetical protein